MEKNKRIKKLKVMYSIALLFDILFAVIAISMGNGLLIIVSFVILIVLIDQLTPSESRYKIIRNRVSNRVRYRLQHCDLELAVYSSRFRYFDEQEHPMDELMDIDYKASYKRHYIKASINEEAFVYHEETLFPTKKIPVINVFQGYVVEFELPKSMNKIFTIGHPLLNERYPKNYVYLNGKTLRVYIPNRRFIEQITDKDNVEEEIADLTNNMKEIIEFKKEFLSTYKEDQ